MNETTKASQFKKVVLIVALLAAGLFLFLRPNSENVLKQISVLSGLMAGDYDGKISLGEIQKYGDFGLGTFNRLDGEGIELDGTFYQVRADGKVLRMPTSVTTPFAMTTFFNPDIKFSTNRLADYRALQEFIDSHLPTKNIPYAIRIDGIFKYIKTRSVPAQKKPYPPFAEVAKIQKIFEFRSIEGTLIGFRMPDYAGGVNVPGYHFHFLSRDKTKGGHVLECAVNSGNISVDSISRFEIILPRSADFDGLNFSQGNGVTLAVEGKK